MLAHPRANKNLYSPKIYQATDFKTARHHTCPLTALITVSAGACSHLPTLQRTPLFFAPRQRNKIETLGCPPPPHHDTAEFSGDRLCQGHPGSWSASSEDFLHAVDRRVHHRETEETRGPRSDHHAFISSLGRRLFILPYEASLPRCILYRITLSIAKPHLQPREHRHLETQSAWPWTFSLLTPFPLPPSGAGSKQTAPLPNLSVAQACDWPTSRLRFTVPASAP